MYWRLSNENPRTEKRREEKEKGKEKGGKGPGLGARVPRVEP
jgi:hypothetical protein